MSDVKNLRPASRIIHAGQRSCPLTGAVATPIYQTSTFAFKDADEGAARFGGTDPGYKYTRLGNPTVAALEECVAELEGAAAPSPRRRGWRPFTPSTSPSSARGLTSSARTPSTARAG
jgi:O-acetylhomoserine/O-acetylserine sulfhydrylase-like pyridoxal-dependent enzyme